VVPATESNYALGNFMTSLRLATAYNETITTVRRSTALIPPHPSLVRQAVWGYSSVIKISIPLLYEFTTGTSDVNVRLEIGRSDGWRSVGAGQGQELTVLEAILKGAIRPTGIRAILTRYPRLTTFASSFAFFFISIIVVTIIIFSAMGSLPPAPPDETASVGEESDGGDSPYPKARRVSKRDLHDEESEVYSDEAWDEEPSKPQASGSRQTSTLRRRSRPEAGPSRTTHGKIKIEVEEPSLKHSSKSPFPHQDSQASTPSTSNELAQIKEEA